EPAVSDLAQQMISGELQSLEPGSFGIVLGEALARTLGVRPGDSVLLMAPQGTVSPAGFSPRMRQMTVTGLFSSGHFEYDSSLAFVNVEDARRLFRQNAQAGVRLRIQDMLAAPRVAQELSSMLPVGLYLTDWSRNNRT